jgi:VWFA-related protein
MIHRYCILSLALISCAAFGQTQAPSPEATLQAGTQLVVVDVVVQDKNGRPVHGLKVSDFELTEGKSPQAIHTFEEHSASSVPAKPEPPLKLPPGIFTDYTPVKPNETLNVLLIDALNTPTKDQSFVRDQLQKYVKNAPAGTRLAIFGLTTHLTLLQGFTSDPEILKDAVEHKLLPRSSVLLDDPTGSNANPESLSDQISGQADSSSGAMAASLTQIAANLADFEARTASFQTMLRVQYTLDAFNALAHYLGAFQGRKNLIWFSGSFPITILPDPDSKSDPFAGVDSKSEEFQQTSALLSRAQVAVYPVDARGLMTNPAFDAASAGPGVRNPRAFASQLNKFTSSQADEHGTMSELANDTGGHAFFNTNGLADAVAKAIAAGSNYYTLSYIPSDRRQNGDFRSIHVALSPSAPQAATLSYRRGYFAGDVRHATAATSAAATPPSAAAGAANTPQQSAIRRADSAYATAALARGAPTPQDILFKVRVAPEIKGTELEILTSNQPDPSLRFLGPFRRYAIDYVTLPQEIVTTLQPDGKRTGTVEFLALLYDVDGKLLNATAKNLALNLPPDTYSRFLHSSINLRLDISVPARKDTYLRLAIHDVPANRFGVVELPAASVANLPVVSPPTAPSTAPPAAPAPSTPPAGTAPPPR